MRWFLGLLLVVALITGALYAVGRFLLPNTLTVTRTVSVERPRVAVFAMINDLRIAKEWSPYYAMDPEAEYTFSGEAPGAGQTMRWTSNVRDVGAGRMSIVSSIENESVESILELRDRATMNSQMELRRGEGATSVSWEVTAQCADGAVNVPCRYMNLIMQRTVATQLERGLARLKELAEQLPDIDFEGLGIVEDTVEPLNVIFVDVSIATEQAPTFADRASAERDGVNALEGFMASAGGQVTRANTVVRVFPSDNGIGGRYRFSVGYPYTGPAPLRLVGVRVGQTPGGAVLKVSFEGRRSQIPLMYQRLDAYRQAHRIGLRPDTEAWEVVTPLAQPASADPSDPVERADIFFPIG